MGDIVERLRETDKLTHSRQAHTELEAADEIERLRTKCSEWEERLEIYSERAEAAIKAARKVVPPNYAGLDMHREDLRRAVRAYDKESTD